MKKLRFVFLALLFFLARPESAMASDGTWQGKQYLKADGNQAANEWVFDAHYQSWFYIKEDANYAENEWLKQGDDYFYLKSGGYMAKSEWVEEKGAFYYLDQDGKMKRNAWLGTSYVGATGAKVIEDWVYDSQYDAWFYIKADGQHAEKEWLQIKGKDYYFKSGGYLLTSQWIEQAYVSASGAKVQQGWLFDKQYQSWFYIKENGNHADKEWIFDKSYNSWFYLKSGGAYASHEWIGDYYLKSGGYMAKNEWIFDSNYNAWYYLKEDGSYVTGGFNIKNKEYFFQSDGKWFQSPKYFKVKPITAYIYSESGDILSYVNQGSIVTYDGSKSKGSRLAVSISGLSGYMNQSDLALVEEGSEFIPHYTTDGRFLYHELSPYTSIRVAPHTSAMKIGKKYYSKDGEHFDGFTIKNRFLFKNLTEPTNYSADELNRVYSMMNIRNSRLAGKGAIFKEAEKRYGVNALYLMAHSTLESAWGRSQIANDKNNFFGIAAYDTSPYDSAKKFDDVDKGILGAAKWIRENYIDRGRDHLGNKATGMNVRYASDPYWGEKIASIMMNINSRLGGKD